ncbi:hypothetical protein [Rickettsia endosymbiont of Orchestes rusci]
MGSRELEYRNVIACRQWSCCMARIFAKCFGVMPWPDPLLYER